jgi:hypothetical protein
MSFLFGGAKRRVEEDLERIRKANLPEKKQTAGDAGGENGLTERGAEPLAEPAQLDKKTIFSLVAAALSVILPYIGGFALLLFTFWALTQLLAGPPT